MKKKIGEIYNKPIVTGDKNLVTKNEIHESTLKGGTVDSGSSDVEYFKFGTNTLGDLGNRILEWCVRLVKGKFWRNGKWEYTIWMKELHNTNVETPWTDIESVSIEWVKFINAFEGVDDNGNDIYLNSLKDELYHMAQSMNTTLEELLTQCGLTPITKEEFYDLNNI